MADQMIAPLEDLSHYEVLGLAENVPHDDRTVRRAARSVRADLHRLVHGAQTAQQRRMALLGLHRAREAFFALATLDRRAAYGGWLRRDVPMPVALPPLRGRVARCPECDTEVALSGQRDAVEVVDLTRLDGASVSSETPALTHGGWNTR